MLRRLISLAMLIMTVDVYVHSLLYPHDIMFYFVANGTIVNIVMVVLVGSAAVVSLQDRFESWWAYAVSAVLAVVVCLVGILSVFTVNTDNWLSGILLPLNSLMILEAGVVLGISVLSYEHAARPAAVRRLSLSWRPRFARLASAFRPPVPGLSRSNHQQRRTQPA